MIHETIKNPTLQNDFYVIQLSLLIEMGFFN